MLIHVYGDTCYSSGTRYKHDNRRIFELFPSFHCLPKQVICDNASHCKHACNVMERVWHHILHSDELQNYSSSDMLKWWFIVELAPWMGGFYERLVGLTKRSTRKAIGKKMLTYNQLITITIIKEAKSVVNARPLVYVMTSTPLSSSLQDILPVWTPLLVYRKYKVMRTIQLTVQ